MSIKIGHAVHDERGKATGGQAGDQTGQEVVTRSWYNSTWHTVLRAKDAAVAKKIATAMQAACDNNNIGYDQNQRTTLYTAAQAVGFDVAKIKVKCETDCSALVAVCVNAAGIKVSKDIYTGNMVSAIMATGAFAKLTESKYLTSDAYLQVGDILVKNGHTAVVLQNGAKVPTTDPYDYVAAQDIVLYAPIAIIRKGEHVRLDSYHTPAVMAKVKYNKKDGEVVFEEIRKA